MQAYTASGPYLSRLEISGLEGKSIPAALYLPDDDYSHMSEAEVARWSRNYLSVPVDGISNFTRIPEVWFWMVRHYRTAEQLTPGVVGLQRDDSRASRIALQAQSLGLPARSYPIDERSSVTALGCSELAAEASTSSACGLRFTIHSGGSCASRSACSWRSRAPTARATSSGSWRSQMLRPKCGSIPGQDPIWRATSRRTKASGACRRVRAITDLRILATPLDWVSQQPESIDLESADAVRLTMSPQLSASRLRRHIR